MLCTDRLLCLLLTVPVSWTLLSSPDSFPSSSSSSSGVWLWDLDLDLSEADFLMPMTLPPPSLLSTTPSSTLSPILSYVFSSFLCCWCSDEDDWWPEVVGGGEGCLSASTDITSAVAWWRSFLGLAPVL